MDKMVIWFDSMHLVIFVILCRLSYSFSDYLAIVGFLDLQAWHFLLKFSPHMHTLAMKI